jgi:hypothetical protein
MKTIDYEEIVGKTIKNIYVSYSNEFLLRFTDDTAIKLHASRGYYDGVDLEFDDELSEYDLLNLDFITKEEYERRSQIRIELDKAQTRIWELKKLEELKRKYES